MSNEKKKDEGYLKYVILIVLFILQFIVGEKIAGESTIEEMLELGYAGRIVIYEVLFLPLYMGMYIVPIQIIINHVCGDKSKTGFIKTKYSALLIRSYIVTLLNYVNTDAAISVDLVGTSLFLGIWIVAIVFLVGDIGNKLEAKEIPRNMTVNGKLAPDIRLIEQQLVSVFLHIEKSLDNKDLNQLKLFMGDNLYVMAESKIKYYEDKGVTVKRKFEHAKGRILTKKNEGEYEVAECLVTLFMSKELERNENTKVGGSQSFAEYRLVFKRPLHKELKNLCPKCGAEIELKMQMRCEYCNTMLSEEYGGWKLYERKRTS